MCHRRHGICRIRRRALLCVQVGSKVSGAPTLSLPGASFAGTMALEDLNVRYFSGYKSILWCSRFRPYLALLPRDPALGPALILPGQETGNGLHTSWIADLVIYPDQEDPTPYIPVAIKERGLDRGTIGMELGFGSVRIALLRLRLRPLRVSSARRSRFSFASDRVDVAGGEA